MNPSFCGMNGRDAGCRSALEFGERSSRQHALAASSLPLPAGNPEEFSRLKSYSGFLAMSQRGQTLALVAQGKEGNKASPGQDVCFIRQA